MLNNIPRERVEILCTEGWVSETEGRTELGPSDHGLFFGRGLRTLNF